jgi:hypothetical protein
VIAHRFAIDLGVVAYRQSPRSAGYRARYREQRLEMAAVALGRNRSAFRPASAPNANSRLPRSSKLACRSTMPHQCSAASSLWDKARLLQIGGFFSRFDFGAAAELLFAIMQ